MRLCSIAHLKCCVRFDKLDCNITGPVAVDQETRAVLSVVYVGCVVRNNQK